MKRLGIIGSGATTVYLLNHINQHIDALRDILEEILIFEKSDVAGTGMPYSPLTTDIHNLSNISSEEIPELPQSFAAWIGCQDAGTCESLNLPYGNASESEVYSRLALGQYLQEQFENILIDLKDKGLTISLKTNCEIIDIKQEPGTGSCDLIARNGNTFTTERVIIATGHFWSEEDDPDRGYYASPWPMQKLIPTSQDYFNFNIGILGASLSAFDVVSSLARRHGDFHRDKKGELIYTPFKGAENFRLSLHAAEGWLPHLQYEQQEPLRKIYRHVSREKLLGMLDENGYLRIAAFFDEVCRPALKVAFQKADDNSILESLEDPDFGFTDFAEAMIADHEYLDAFEGMKKEMDEASCPIANTQTIYWKEVTDDLMYCLNYHAELLPAEDHILLKQKIMPFLLNVIAAMPLQSAQLLLALYEAGKVELIPGLVEVSEKQEKDKTRIELTYLGKKRVMEYRMFVDCSGQEAITWEEFPFDSLKSGRQVRPARAKFVDEDAVTQVPESIREKIEPGSDGPYYRIGGIDIDATFRIISADGQANPAIHNLNFTHTLGKRPYAYGLQACSTNSRIVVASWVDEIRNKYHKPGSIAAISRIYQQAGEA